MPKGVLWRNADFFVGALGGLNRKQNREYESYEEIAEAAGRGTLRWMTSAPFMHGAAQWIACLLYTSPSPRDGLLSRMPSSA